MDIHYNAFISYRHHPDDMRVAAEVHRSLERFRVPRAIKKRSGVINRIFRDKEELPITSRLTEDITRALQNSDYLIVICSEHTKESVWVQREIETFLLTHSRDEVLTVLAGGDPYEVMPEILLYEDVVDPETGETRREERELLSCDWRMGLRKAKREELPRLAAPLLKCSYDELRQRQRQYRMRRMITGFSAALVAALCLAAYFLHTSITIQKANVQIQANLEQALRNQSVYLTAESGERLSAGDRFAAIALALEALPGETGERPYVAGAERALCDALGMYESESFITAVGTIFPDYRATIEEIALSDDYQTLYVLDSRGVITIWDALTMEQRASVDLGERFLPEMHVLPGGGILIFVHSESTVWRYDENGNLCWVTNDCVDVACTDDGESVLLIQRRSEGCLLVFVDPATGEEREAVFLISEDEMQYPEFCQIRYDVDAPVVISCDSFDIKRILAVDPDTGGQMVLMETENYIRYVSQTEDGKILLMVSDGSGSMNGLFFDMVTTSFARSDVYCFNSENGELLWQSEIVTYSYSPWDTLTEIPGRDRILCQSGNTLQQLDSETGEVLAVCETSGMIMKIIVEEKYARILQRDGYCGTYDYDNNHCGVISILKGNLQDVEFGWGNDKAWYYGCWPEEGQVTIYSPWESEPEWSVKGSLSEYVCQGNLLAYYSVSDGITMLDMQTRERLWTAAAEVHELLGFSSDESTLWAASYGNVIALDAKTGEYDIYEQPQEIGGEQIFSISEMSLYGDSICYTGKVSDMWYLAIWEPHMESVRYIHLRENAAEDAFVVEDLSMTTCLAWNDYVWLWGNDGTIWEVNVEDESVRLLPERSDKRPSFAVREDGMVVLAAGTDLVLRMPGGSMISKSSLNGVSVGSIVCYEGWVYALCDNGFVMVFDGDGNQVAQVEVDVDTDFAENLFSEYRESTDVLWWFTEDGDIILKAFYAVSIIDRETWGCRGYALYCSWYDAGNDMLVFSREGYILGHPLKTTEENIADAREMLGNYQLSTEQKVSYGIE